MISETPSSIDVVDVVGELDVGAADDLERTLAERIDEGRSLVIDLSDCTFLDVAILRALRSSYVRAREADALFFVVLPFSASPEVRLAMLHLASGLVPYPVVPDRASAVVQLSRASRTRLADMLNSERLLDLRARVWENGHRRERLLSERDVLILTQREALRRRPRRVVDSAG